MLTGVCKGEDMNDGWQHKAKQKFLGMNFHFTKDWVACYLPVALDMVKMTKNCIDFGSYIKFAF